MGHQQLVAQIRYQLERLRARNAQHEFEHLCRQLARCRISERVLPATGPVGTGGDQGRDFETYQSYTRERNGGASQSFRVTHDDKKLAFCCTLQTDNLPVKIRTDVQSVCATGSKPDSIYIFCEANLPVSRRHSLQSWALEQHQVILEILDGEAIAEQLSAPDTFWIAEDYLGVPVSEFPKSPEHHVAYQKQLALWKGSKKKITNLSSFLLAQSNLRYCVENEDLRADCSFWNSLFEEWHKINGLPPPLRRKAIYEICWSTLNVKGHLLEVSDLLSDYYSTVQDDLTTIELKQASTLLTYAYGIWMGGGLNMSLEQLHAWRRCLLDEAERRLDIETRPSQRCLLLEQKGFLHLIPWPGADVDADRIAAVKSWTQILDLLSKAHMYPLERFLGTLAEVSSMLSSTIGFKNLCARLDDALAQRAGRVSAARTRTQRAHGHRKVDDLLSALTELHNAKSPYFSHESTFELATVLAEISHIYEELGMHLAAKYYALATAALGEHSEDEGVIRMAIHGLRCVGDADFLMGMWVGCIESFNLVLLLTAATQETADVEGDKEQLDRVIAIICLIEEAAKETCLPLGQDIESLIAKNPFVSSIRVNEEMARHILGQARSNPEYELPAIPFSDIGVRRHYSWKALGVEWSISCSNDLSGVMYTEALAAAVQIVLVELAALDPCFLPGQVSINVIASSFHGVQTAKYDDGKCSVVVGVDEDVLNVSNIKDLFAVAIEICVVPSSHADWTMMIVEEMINTDIFGKLMIGAPYWALLQVVKADCQLPRPTDAIERMAYRVRSLSEHPGLRPPLDIAPWLEENEIVRVIWRRYDRITRSIPRTLTRLMNDEISATAIGRIRALGFKDWHILGAVANWVANLRFQHEAGRPPAGEQDLSQLLEIIQGGDSASSFDPPLEHFDESSIKMAECAFLGAFVSGSGVCLPDGYSDWENIRAFAKRRLGYDKDIESRPDFTSPPESPAR